MYYKNIRINSPFNKLQTPSREDVLAASAILARSLCIVHPISPNIPTLNNRNKNIYIYLTFTTYESLTHTSNTHTSKLITSWKI